MASGAMGSLSSIGGEEGPEGRIVPRNKLQDTSFPLFVSMLLIANFCLKFRQAMMSSIPLEDLFEGSM